MSNWIRGVVAASLFVALSTSSAFAGPIPAGGLTRQQVLKWFLSKGYTAELKHDNTANDDFVSVTTKDASWGLYFYACTGQTCTSLQYSAGWNGASNIDDTELNGWNRDKRFIRAYRADGGGVFGEYDVDIAPGGSWEQLSFSVSRWESQLAVFKTFVQSN